MSKFDILIAWIHTNLACIVGVAIAYFIYADKILNKSKKKNSIKE